jgi:hypothetical protein
VSPDRSTSCWAASFRTSGVTYDGESPDELEECPPPPDAVGWLEPDGVAWGLRLGLGLLRLLLLLRLGLRLALRLRLGLGLLLLRLRLGQRLRLGLRRTGLVGHVPARLGGLGRRRLDLGVRGVVCVVGPAAGGVGRVADDGEHAAHLDGLVLAGLDLQQGAGDRGGDLGVDLVGGDLEQRLVDLDRVADLLQPAGHGTLGDALSELRQRDLRATTAGRLGVGLRSGGVGLGLLGRLAVLRRLADLGRRLRLLLLLGAVLRRLSLVLLTVAGVRLLSPLVGGRLLATVVGGRLLALVRGLGRLLLRPVVGAGVAAARRLVGVADDRQHRPHLDRLVLVGLDLQQRAGDRGRDLGVDLVGGDLEQRLVDLDGVAYLLQPAGDGAFGDALAQLRKCDVGGHGGLRLLGVVSPDLFSCVRAGACRPAPARPRPTTRFAWGGRG